METDGESTSVTELIGIYHADGSVIGELRYWVGARLGRAHCSLCDVTHGLFREKESWREASATVPVPFTTRHLDERDDELRSLTDGATPCIVARTTAGMTVLVSAAEIESCAGSPAELVRVIAKAAERAGLTYPPT